MYTSPRASTTTYPRAAYHDQTVEVALGPNGAFEDGNVGTVTLRVVSGRAVSAVPRARGDPKPPRAPKTPRVVELLRKAMEWQALLESGDVSSQAEITRREGITRAHVTQVMGMLNLAPEIQEYVHSLADTIGRAPITERELRPIAQISGKRKQLRILRQLLRVDHVAAAKSLEPRSTRRARPLPPA